MILLLQRFDFKLVESILVIISNCDNISFKKFDEKMNVYNKHYSSIIKKKIITLPRTGNPFGNFKKTTS